MPRWCSLPASSCQLNWVSDRPQAHTVTESVFSSHLNQTLQSICSAYIKTLHTPYYYELKLQSNLKAHLSPCHSHLQETARFMHVIKSQHLISSGTAATLQFHCFPLMYCRKIFLIVTKRLISGYGPVNNARVRGRPSRHCSTLACQSHDCELTFIKMNA